MKKKFGTVVVGGTFDEFHKGHRVLLMKAFEVGNNVIIGLCSDDFVKKLGKPHRVASYNKRLEELTFFLRNNGFLAKVDINKLDDPYGVTLSKDRIEAIVVSKETAYRAQEINEKRLTKGLTPLHVVVINMVPAEDRTPISTTRIQRKEIDHEGRLL